MILLLDNYDSFTYNLVQGFEVLGQEVHVEYSDALSVDDVANFKPQAVIISPGPGRPENAGICCDVIRQLGASVPILGVCLGHQCIAHTFGGIIKSASSLAHGYTNDIYHDSNGIYAGLPKRHFSATCYNSLVVDQKDLPDCLDVSAWTENSQHQIQDIVGVRHKQLSIEGVQFHPESILSEFGQELLSNFLQRYVMPGYLKQNHVESGHVESGYIESGKTLDTKAEN